MLEFESSEQFLAGGGEMGQLIRSMDWSTTPLGPIASWPQSLRTSVSLCLSSTFPILIAWGPDTIQLYNDSYRPICGAKHPESMGQNFRICWETALPVVGDAFTRGQQGEGTYIKDQRMFLDRYGYLEEAFMTFSFAPIRDESGEVGGIFHPITETTDKILSARRTQVLRDMAALTGQAKTNQAIYASLATAKSDIFLDLPFLLFYELDEDGQQARLVNTLGLPPTQTHSPTITQLTVAETEWLADLAKPLVIDQLDQRVGILGGGPYPEPPHTAVRLPIMLSTRAQPIGFILAGVSPRRAIDQDYLTFYDLLANTISTAFSNVYAYQQEQQRAESLAAIDRAKTAFFSNVSHEFRTPLTLMLGPLDELVQDKELQTSAYREPVE
ncbi:MAG: histidine kinase, partial [Cytophagaceae bacterium]